MERGSRKHVLDWTEQPDFLAELESLLSPIPVSISPGSYCMPRGYGNPQEARLESFLSQALPDMQLSAQLQEWWLVHTRGANTPNWDIAVACEVEGRRGLVLVEAKANWPELGRSGKKLPEGASPHSVENHLRIGTAIEESLAAWQQIDSGVAVSRDTHYQLSNRLAFSWKLASLGIPVVLIYLGFMGDDGIRDAGEPFRDDANWRAAFSEYAASVVPIELFEMRHDFGSAPVWLGVRSARVLEISPPRAQAKQSLGD